QQNPFTLTILEAPTITSANNATFTVGVAGTTFNVTASGNPFSTFSTGALPSGLSLASNGTLSGTPALGTGGVYNITMMAANGVSPNATQPFTLTVQEQPAFTSGASTTFTVGVAGNFPVTASGTPAPTFSTTDPLPAGVTLAPDGTLSGTPQPGTGKSWSITITATNVVGSVTQPFTLSVDEAPAITSAGATTFTVGSGGTFNVTTTGFPLPALNEAGTLPTGVTFTDNGDGTATLAGTPNPGQGGTYPFTITAHNGIGTDATQNFILTVNEAPTITSANATTFIVGQVGTFSVTATGFPTPT